jgi:hypothetical protein
MAPVDDVVEGVVGGACDGVSSVTVLGAVGFEPTLSAF